MIRDEFVAALGAVLLLGLVAASAIYRNIGQFYVLPGITAGEAVFLAILIVGWLGIWYWEFQVIRRSRYGGTNEEE